MVRAGWEDWKEYNRDEGARRIGRNRTRLGGGGIGKKDRAGRARRIGRNLSICPTVQYPKLLSFFR